MSYAKRKTQVVNNACGSEQPPLYRMGERLRNGCIKAFGSAYASLADLLMRLQIENWKRRRHGLKEASHYVKFRGKARVLARTLSEIQD